jgi:hypothetical protein
LPGEKGIRRHWCETDGDRRFQLRCGLALAAASGRERIVAGSLLFLESFLKRRKWPMALGMWRMGAWMSLAALKRDAAAHEIFEAQGPESRNEGQWS